MRKVPRSYLPVERSEGDDRKLFELLKEKYNLYSQKDMARIFHISEGTLRRVIKTVSIVPFYEKRYPRLTYRLYDQYGMNQLAKKLYKEV